MHAADTTWEFTYLLACYFVHYVVLAVMLISKWLLNGARVLKYFDAMYSASSNGYINFLQTFEAVNK